MNRDSQDLNIKVTRVDIDKFRSFRRSLSFPIFDKITLIAGQNGTAKSTLLGMIAQPLGFPIRKKCDSAYTDAYHGIDLSSYKTISGKHFKADYSDVFRMSKEYDKPQSHKYTVFVDGTSIIKTSLAKTRGLVVTSIARNDQKDNHLRFVTNADTRKPGEGNLPHPVIFLGLERLRPLATCINISTTDRTLDDDDKKFFEKNYKRILNTPPDVDIYSEEINTGKDKGTYQSVRTAEYDATGTSAGQDNIGQILTAVISFRKLKKELGDRYQGGVLLIDELDASLHTVSQELLFDVLLEVCNDLKLQVVATTHSLCLLEYANKSTRTGIGIILLKRFNNFIDITPDVSIDYIRRDLAQIRIKKNNALDRTTVLFEDDVASYFFKGITGNIFSKCIKIPINSKNNSSMSFSDSELIKLSKYNIPELERVIFVVDPDVANKVKGKKNLIALPGEYPIEKLMYYFLSTISDDNSIWEQKIDCTKQECFRNFNYFEEDTKTDSYKKWFNNCRINGYFKIARSVLFKEWVKQNKMLARKFCLDFLDILKKLHKGDVLFDGEALKEKIDKKYR